jgi:hypothetical protein
MEMSLFLDYAKLRFRFLPRIYFAPLTGAIRGIREEYARLHRDERAAIAEWERKHGLRESGAAGAR